MKIGIFGGTFDPIHNGHIKLALSLLERASLDEVWFVVSPQNPFKKDKLITDDAVRLKMVEDSLQPYPPLRASDVEFSLPKPSYMYHTLETLRERWPEHSFTLLIGGDNWESFSRWYRYEDILREFCVVVYPRPGYTLPLPGEGVTVVDVPLMDISSTAIREKVKCGLDISSLVPAQAAEVIRSSGLYK